MNELPPLRNVFADGALPVARTCCETVEKPYGQLPVASCYPLPAALLLLQSSSEFSI
jgi:hypothetical protein